jgi:16S rRNA (cytosine967-C5)-methyltransferase
MALANMRRLQKEGHFFSGMLLSSVPLWIAGALAERQKASGWSEQLTARFLESQASRPPLWMRLNHPDQREQALRILTQEGFRVECVDDALSVLGERGIFVSEAYKQGLLEIQDYASQRAGAAVQAKPGDIVWDACAGGGGKTLQIASRLQNRGAVYASDVREFKLEEVKKRARRAGFFNVRCQAWDGVALPDFPREVQKRGGFDWVLVDAPCSSSGTWRRNPDAKYRIDEGTVHEITLLQKGILRNAAEAVSASGHLVYSTCSWLVQENEAVVNAFLAENSEFELVRMGLLGTPAADSDTLFAAVLCKKSRA